MYITSKETNKRNLLTTTHTSPLSSTPPRAAVREIWLKRYLKKICIHQKRPTKETNVYWKRPTKETQRKTNQHQNRPTKIERDLQKRPAYIKRDHKEDLRISKKTYKWNQRTSKETNKRDIRGRKSASLTATHCNTLQYNATTKTWGYWTLLSCVWSNSSKRDTRKRRMCIKKILTKATHSRQHAATCCDALQHHTPETVWIIWSCAWSNSSKKAIQKRLRYIQNNVRKWLTDWNTPQHAATHCNKTQRSLCKHVYPRSSCHVNLTRHLLWSHGWWKKVPIDEGLYQHEKFTLSQAIEISQILWALSRCLLGGSTLQGTWFSSWWFRWTVFFLSKWTS